MPETPEDPIENGYESIITSDNSYLTIEQADEVSNTEITSGLWEQFEPRTKEILLIRATEEVDSYIFLGKRLEQQQPLEFPRKMLPDRFYDGIIPSAVLKATYRIAVSLYESNPDESYSEDGALQEVWTSDVKLRFRNGGTNSKSTYPRSVTRLLMPFLSNGGQVELIRG